MVRYPTPFYRMSVFSIKEYNTATSLGTELTYSYISRWNLQAYVLTKCPKCLIKIQEFFVCNFLSNELMN